MPPTVAELCTRFMADYSRLRNKPSTQKGYQVNIRRSILPVLGRIKVQEVKRSDVALMMRRMERVPGSANRTLSCLGQIFNMAEVWGDRPDGTNLCRHVPHYPQRNSNRLITDEEMVRLFRYLDRAEAEAL